MARRGINRLSILGGSSSPRTNGSRPSYLLRRLCPPYLATANAELASAIGGTEGTSAQLSVALTDGDRGTLDTALAEAQRNRAG